MSEYTKYNFVNGVVFNSKKEYVNSTRRNKNIYCNCNFMGFDIEILNGSIFIDCKFYDISIINNIYVAKFENCTFVNINIDGSHTENLTIEINADFDYCKFEKLNINRCFIGTNSNFKYCDFKDMIIQHCTINADIILACTFYFHRSIVVMNSSIYSVITNCDIFGSYPLYLYKCHFYESTIYDNNSYSNSNSYVLIYESNFIDALRQICPKEGSFICYKKVYTKDNNGVLATLEIPADAKRIYTTGRKCRAEYAKVIKLELIADDNQEYEEVDTAYSGFKDDFVYRKGEMIYPDSFDDNMIEVCSNGIHFFMDKNEAINY